MKKITLLFVLFTAFSYAQETQNGYYIINSGQRVEGMFIEGDYLNPSSLKFKSSSDTDFQKLNLESITEYGVGKDYKSVKHSVEIDATDATHGQISTNKDATWQLQTIFLNVLLEGEATLYSYRSGKGTKYFYKVNGKQAEPQQLLYRVYMSTANTTAENNKFRQQLYNDVSCPTEKNGMDKFLAIKYTSSDILPLFKDYNNCNNSKFTTYKNNDGKRVTAYYSVLAGLYQSRFNIEGIDPEVDNATDIAFGVGAEVVIVLPSEKIGLFIKAEYEKLKSEVISTYITPYGSSKTHNRYYVDASLFNFNVGPRYFYNINKQNKVFVDASLLLTFGMGDINHAVTVETPSQTFPEVFVQKLPFNSAIALNFGLGYTYNNKFSIEARFDSNRNFFNNALAGSKTISGRTGIVLKYTIN